MLNNRIHWPSIGCFVAFVVLFGASRIGWSGENHDNRDRHQPRIIEVVVPGEDRFTPFSITIHPGDIVKWTNTDSDDHTVVSDDDFTTAGKIGTNHLLQANGGTFQLRFSHPGVFVYYCRFHAHLDVKGQPVAPGPDGGIQDSNGNYGTPMMGVINVLPRSDD